METLKLEDLQNPITEIVTRLPEIGDPIWLLQHKIDAAAAEIRSLESKIESIRGWNERDKQKLFEMVKRNYTDSEIEAADVMITRLRP
jgi:prefoldin subunit 5